MNKKIKSFNKILSLTSLFSIAMLMIPFSVHAADNGEGTGDPMKFLNANINQQYPNTDNPPAIYADIRSEDARFFTEPNEQNFCLKINGKCVNCKTGKYSDKCDVEVSNIDKETKYKIPTTTKDVSGFYAGGTETILNEGGNDFSGKFFRYWDEKAESNGYVGAYSAAYPKICYTGFTNTEKGIEPLKNLVKEKMKYITTEDGKDYLQLSVKSYNNVNKTASGIYKGTDVSGMVPVKNFKIEGSCLDPIVNEINDTARCPSIDKTYYYSDGNCSKALTNCSNLSSTNCSTGQIKNYYRDSAEKNPYRTSAHAIVDILGNTRYFEIPQQTCFVCSAIDSGINGSDCATIVKEAFNGNKQNCEDTVKSLVTNLSSSRVDRFSMYKTGVPCSCLTKIEGLLRGLGCN